MRSAAHAFTTGQSALSAALPTPSFLLAVCKAGAEEETDGGRSSFSKGRRGGGRGRGELSAANASPHVEHAKEEHRRQAVRHGLVQSLRQLVHAPPELAGHGADGLLRVVLHAEAKRAAATDCSAAAAR